LKETYKSFYPESAKAPEVYARIVTSQAFKRVKSLLDNTKGEVVFRGETDAETKSIAPTVIKNVSVDDSPMSEEVFGPLLPIVPVKDVDEAINFVNER
jgi:aldehyde dehydrogenase (NAD+)